MKTTAIEEMEEQSCVAMDVDDVDPLDVFGEGVLAVETKVADADFFNNFEDDFDDTDIK
uniref:Small acidic protein 1 n=1 Tax=Kalanchoe fedtschenkoi TaxID=63787 RepID=A0A7N0TUI5_KALFE